MQHSHQNSMVLAQKQKYRSMEQDRKPRNKPMHLQTTNAIEDVEGRELSCTVGRNVNWYSHYGEKYGNSLKN